MLAALVLSMLDVPQAPVAAAATKSSETFERPDSGSAMQSAIALDHRIEDLSQRDEFGSVFANPDGTWTAETAPEPVQVEDPETGAWSEVDTTLVDTGRVIRPAAVSSDLTLSRGGDRVFARMTTNGQSVEWRWPSTLPKPSLDGATATYPDVAPGQDLVVEATSSGFQHFVVLREAPAAGFKVKLPMATHGAVLSETAQGGLVIKHAGHVLVNAAPPVMWDASRDAAGEPAVDLVDASVSTPASGRPVLTLTPDQGFLLDPKTVYPVTIDPTFSKYTSGDVWVQNAGYTTGQTSSPELRAGTYDSGAHKARSFIHFDSVNSTIAGKQILSATLTLRNWYSGSCTGAAIKASKITESWSGSTLTWANQPGVGTLSDTYSTAKGYTSACPGGDATWDVKTILQNWADNTANNNGIRLAAVDETSIYTWRKYRSANYGTQSVRPKLTITYNNKPNTPTDLQVVTNPPSNSGYSVSTTPTFKAKVTDPEGGSLTTQFKVFNGSTQVGTTQSVSVSSGSVASKTWPSGQLVNGNTYTLKVTATDTNGLVSAVATKNFTVDTSAPTVTSVVSSAGLTDGGWTTSPPASNRFTISGSGGVVAYRVWRDGVLQAQTLSTVSQVASLDWNPQSDYHTLKVTPLDAAGNEGGEYSFGWGVGPAGVRVPDPASIRSFGVRFSGPPNATGASVQWRVIGGTWNPVNPASLTTSAGTQWSGSVTTAGGSSTSGDLVWDSFDVSSGQTAPTAPQTLEMKVCFTYAGSADQCGRGSMQLVEHAIGGNFPTASMGPAQVGMQTGEALLGSTDAADAEAGAARMFMSFDEATKTAGDYGLGWRSVPLTDGAGPATVVDNRAPSDRFVLQLPGWGDQTYLLKTGSSDTYLPEGFNDGSKLVISGATQNKLTLVPLTGSNTTWTLSDGEWVLESVADPGAGTGTTTSSSSGGVTFLSQAAAGTTSCNLSAQTAGCRGLKITKTSGLVTQIERVVGGTTPTSTTVAAYTYAGQQLTKVCNPSLNICTTYTYTTVNGRTLVATVTPNNQKAWELGYDSQGRLATVRRLLDGSTTAYATWTARYDLGLGLAGIPAITAGTAVDWGQTKLPTRVAAVWNPERVPDATPTAGDMSYAHVYWYNEPGAVTNVGSNNGSTWLVRTTWYDEKQRPVQTLDGASWAQVQSLPAADRPAAAYKASSITVFNTALDRVEDEFGPVHQATLKDGTTGSYRAHAAYEYDDEVPAAVAEGMPALPAGETSWNLVIDTTTSAANPDLTGVRDPQLVRNVYAPVGGSDGSGWDFGIPTQVKTQLGGGGWSTEINRINTRGETIETRQPGGTGTDDRSTLFTYYTADASSGDPECNNKPKLDGLVCKTGPAGAAGLLPTTFNADYNDDQQPTSVIETNGNTVRTTTNTYDAAGRIKSTGITVAGGDAADPALPTTAYAYNPDGTLDSQTAGGETIAYTYDTWGRPKTYTDASALTSTTTYSPSGEVATFNDGSGTYSYAYSHGVLSTVDVGLSTGPDVFTYTWNNRGAPDTVTYPNGTVASFGYDELGTPTGISYTNGATSLADYTNTVDVSGRVVASSSNLGDQTYGYDELGRLTKVEDDRDAAAGCVTRVYTFSAASERTGKTSYGPGADGACQTTTADTTWSGTYNAANQLTNSGYTYDNLGRRRAAAAADTTADATGALSATYYPNDMVASLTQQVDDGTDTGTNITKTNSYGLDPTGRIDLITSTAGGTETQRLMYRYAADSDSATRIDTSLDGGATWNSSRNLTVPGVGYVGTAEATVTWALSNLHGDSTATQTDATGPSTLSSNAETDEYGLAITTSPGRYGYLGAYQRSSDALGGLTLMGARLYSPVTGSFGSVDSVLGGTVTRYAYPVSPVVETDTTGQYARYWWGGFNYYKVTGPNYYRIWFNHSFMNYLKGQFGTFVSVGEWAAAIGTVLTATPLAEVAGPAAVAGAIMWMLGKLGGYAVRWMINHHYGVGVRWWPYLGKYAYLSTFAWTYGT